MIEPFTSKMAAVGLVGFLVYATTNEIKFGQASEIAVASGGEPDTKGPAMSLSQLDPSLRLTRWFGDAKNSQLYYEDALDEKDLNERTLDVPDDEDRALRIIDSKFLKMGFGVAVLAYVYSQF